MLPCSSSGQIQQLASESGAQADTMDGQESGRRKAPGFAVGFGGSVEH